MQAQTFLKSFLLPISEWRLSFVALSALYFFSILVGALLAQIPGFAVRELPTSTGLFDLSANPVALAASTFVFNLVLSGFLLTTLSGLLFFVFPVGVISLRALTWGGIIAQATSPQFFGVLPTFVLEGEAYVIAAQAGIILGLSWLKPSWAFKGERLSRMHAFREASKSCARLYFWVALLLFVSSIVEVVTLIYS